MGKKAMCFNKNYPIFICEVEDNAAITRLYEVIDEAHMPIMLQDDGFNLEKVNLWISQRKIPENREGLEKARKMFRGFECYRNMFSLSDQYWFQFNQKENWSRLNYFTNEYQKETGKIFIKPWEVTDTKIKKESPDLTTNGVLRKRWIRQENGVSYLIKSGSRKYNQNPVSEILTTMFLEELNIIPFVRYEMAVDGLKLCSKCENFVDQDTEFVPVSQVYYKTERKKATESVYEHIVKQSVAYGLKEDYVKDYLNCMITADIIIHNSDRHLNNFGYIRDVDTGKILGFAPLFDSGTAFLKSKNVKTQNMFRDRSEKAFREIIKRVKNESFSEEDMLNLVSNFPTLTREEKALIRKKITESADMIRRGMKGSNRIKAKERLETRVI